jgi:cytochrome c556
MTRTRVLWTACAAAVLGGLLWGGVLAQVEKGKTRPAATKYLMRGISQQHCAALGKLLKDGPADDKAWDTAACHASCLNELGHLLMDDGRCPDATWANAAKTLREQSAAVLEAAQKKDLDGARGAFEKLTGACAACHKAHRKN